MTNRIAETADMLLRYFEEGRTFQGSDIKAVPADKYFDPTIWRDEIELVFKRVPLMLALSCELPAAGDYKAMEAVGLPILISRDREGKVHAFLNVCAHRWAPVAAEGRGKCKGFRFTCPFHGWSYRCDGRLAGVADQSKFGAVDKEKHSLRQLPCEERHGMIFVCLTPGAPIDLDAYYHGLLEDFARFDLANSFLLGTSELEGANWKIVFTNFLESYHFAAQHPETVSRHWVPDLCHYEAFGPHLRIGFAQHSIAGLRNRPREQWGELEAQGFTFMRYLFPNVTASFYPSETSVFMQVLPGATPRGAGSCCSISGRRNPKMRTSAKGWSRNSNG